LTNLVFHDIVQVLKGGLIMRKILVVDDSQEVADLIAAYLRSKEFEVYVAYDPEEALRLLKEHGPLPDDLFDLMITDNEMPGMTGEELVAKAREEFPTLKIMMISSVQPGSEDQLDFFMKKPLDLLFLHEVVNGLTVD